MGCKVWDEPWFFSITSFIRFSVVSKVSENEITQYTLGLVLALLPIYRYGSVMLHQHQASIWKAFRSTLHFPPSCISTDFLLPYLIYLCHFLGVPNHLYNWLCLLDNRLVGWSVTQTFDDPAWPCFIFSPLSNFRCSFPHLPSPLSSSYIDKTVSRPILPPPLIWH